jgi:hypothetical protein
MAARTVSVPPERMARWLANFGDRHEGCSLTTADGCLVAWGSDGAHAALTLPFSRSYDGPADAAAFTAAAAPPRRWGVLLVRKGGFAVALLAADRVMDSKVGQRHVQGRTKAGGQSQQRFARRRENQARVAYQAAADHAARLLSGIEALVCGGDRAAVAAVLADQRLAGCADRRVGPWLPVPDPRRRVLDEAVQEARSCRASITD